jgi:hypothetical protein
MKLIDVSPPTPQETRLGDKPQSGFLFEAQRIGGEVSPPTPQETRLGDKPQSGFLFEAQLRFVARACCVAIAAVGCAADRTPDPEPVDVDPVAEGPRALKSVGQGPTLNNARDHHTSFVLEIDGQHHFYVLGGVANMTTPLRNYEHGIVDDNGGLSPLQAQALPTAAFSIGAGVATVGNTAVITGGMRANAEGRIVNAAGVDVVTAEADGTLTFARGPDLPFPCFHGSAAIVNGRVYVVGGQGNANADASTDRVVSAALNADNSLSSWRDETPLPSSLSHHGLLATSDALVIVGGLTGSPFDGQHDVHDEVLRIPVNADGSLGDTVVIGALPYHSTTPALALVDERLYVIGGLVEDRAVTNDVLQAPLVGAALGEFTSTVVLPQERMHAHQAPVVGDRFFLAGGATLDEASNHESHDTVYVGTFAP